MLLRCAVLLSVLLAGCGQGEVESASPGLGNCAAFEVGKEDGGETSAPLRAAEDLPTHPPNIRFSGRDYAPIAFDWPARSGEKTAEPQFADTNELPRITAGAGETVAFRLAIVPESVEVFRYPSKEHDLAAFESEMRGVEVCHPTVEPSGDVSLQIPRNRTVVLQAFFRSPSGVTYVPAASWAFRFEIK